VLVITQPPAVITMISIATGEFAHGHRAPNMQGLIEPESVANLNEAEARRSAKIR